MLISKDIKFDCAHMLSDYKGKCANLHGHTYHGSVSIESNVDDSTFMVLDYNEIKDVVDEFDHAIVFSHVTVRNFEEQELYKWTERHGMRSVEMPEDYPKSTAECMCEVIAHAILAKIPNLVTASKVTVRLSETDGSWAEVTI